MSFALLLVLHQLHHIQDLEESEAARRAFRADHVYVCVGYKAQHQNKTWNNRNNMRNKAWATEM